MKHLLHPRWIFILNTTAILALFFLCWGQYSIINTLLDDTSKAVWWLLGGSLMGLGVLQFGYAIYLTTNDKKIHWLYAPLSLMAYIAFLLLFFSKIDVAIPREVPSWMMSEIFPLYIIAFTMPTLAHAMAVAMIYLTPDDREHNITMNILIAIAMPLSAYLFGIVIVPSLLKFVDNTFLEYVFVIIFICGTITFLFFLVRTAYLLSMQGKGGIFREFPLLWRIPLGIVFPLVGLALNNGIFPYAPHADNYVFGDFSNAWFYGLALLNGILFCLPKIDNVTYRFFLYMLQSIFLTYIFYFFIVFLPFLPFSIIAVIAVGTGFLMLTPLFLFIVMIGDLLDDYHYLSKHFSKKILSICSGLSIMLLPFIITSIYRTDKRALHSALDHIYEFDTTNSGKDISSQALARSIKVLKEHKKASRGEIIFSHETPYLSSYYNWLVLDNLTISNEKIEKIEQVFLGKKPTVPPIGAESAANVKPIKITNITKESTYNSTNDTWTSWVELELSNETNNNLTEYKTSFELPVGCWIADHYLYIGERKEAALLAERKSAIWVYSQIRNERRDPSLLHYLDGREVSFSVFPFLDKEKRRTGIKFLHKEPVNLLIDGEKIALGDSAKQTKTLGSASISKEAVAYVSAKEKMNLTLVERKPYFHFLVDASALINENKKSYIKKIQNFVQKNSNGEAYKISVVDARNTEFSSTDEWQKQLEAHETQGGFFLERAVYEVLAKAAKEPKNTYPRLVVISDSLLDAVWEGDLSQLATMATPEEYGFISLGDGEQTWLHHFGRKALTMPSQDYFTKNNKVFAFPNSEQPRAFLANDGMASIALLNPNFEIEEALLKAKNWEAALLLEGKSMAHRINPKVAADEWQKAVSWSFTSGIMTPLTSYIALENEAQKAALLHKQKQVLDAKKSLDISDETLQMAEPNEWLLGIGIVLLLITIHFYKRKHILQKNIYKYLK